jgi:uncharacterized protein YjbI with pentapeptide repeats
VLVAVIFYFAETGDRIKQRHYQAWQVINTAEGKGGSGGRIEALHELNEDRVPLVGVDVSGAFLQGLELVKASLMRANLQAVDLRNCNLHASDLRYAELQSANLRGGDLTGVDFSHATLTDADLNGANLSGANLTRADLSGVDLSNTNLRGIVWRDLKAVDSLNLYGVSNAPPGFVEWAMQHGAQSTAGEAQ